MTQVSHPLYIVTRSDLSAGYQTAQVAHAVADFAKNRTHEFLSWHTHNQYIVILSVSDADSLEVLYSKAIENSLDAILFREPDINNQLTSIAFVPSNEIKNFLSHLPLAGKKQGTLNKNTFN